MLTSVRKIEGNVQVNLKHCFIGLFPYARATTRGRRFIVCVCVCVCTQVMEKMLRKYLNDENLRSRVDELTGTIVFHGNHRGKIVKWLKQMGF